MPVFIQTSSSDISSNDVIDWLFFLSPDQKIIRWNDQQTVSKVSYNIGNRDISVSIENECGYSIHSDELSACWYRRGELTLPDISIDAVTAAGSRFSSAIKYYADWELKSVIHNIDAILDQLLPSINRSKDNDNEKIDNLIHAVNAGLLIPNSLVTNDIAELIGFVDKHRKIITKAFASNAYKLDFGEEMYGGIVFDTTLLTHNTIMSQAEVYKNIYPLPAFYQAYIEKRFELRIFYFNGECYPMAIFSQENEKTKIDFRKYDQERPNRCVPYKLPDTIRQRLEAFMQSVRLNSGSIDMIVTPAGDYVFLEVNPIGQFKWLSKNCNYDIEQQIAHYLINQNYG